MRDGDPRSNLKIVADENLARVEMFDGLGQVTTMPGRAMTPAAVRDADVVLTRSVTRVDPALLDGSRVKFVGSATSGIDHVDVEYLRHREIRFAHAPGSNANAVVQYFFSALAWLSTVRNSDWRNWSIGIVGAGNVGGLLARSLRALGMDFLIHDPFLLPDSEHGDKLVSLEDILQQDVITLHCPLTHGGPHPTYHLFNAELIARLYPAKILINAARGEVVDNKALADRLRQNDDLFCVLDTWENEPAVNKDLLARVLVGTPHIAGYSIDGKILGSLMLYEALSRWMGRDVVNPASGQDSISLGADVVGQGDGLTKLNRTLLAAYDIHRDHSAMQTLLDDKVQGGDVDTLFDQLRKHYPERREFHRYAVKPDNYPTDILDALVTLGFRQSCE